MKKSELDTLRYFVRHVELLLPLLPKVIDSSRHSPKTCNARRLIGRELERVKKITENVKTANDNEHETDNTATG